MSAGNVTFYSGGNFGTPGVLPYQVAAGAVGSIKFGEPVKIGGTNNVVVPLADAEPVIGTTTPFVGIALNTSTDTVAAAGTVSVWKPEPGVVYLCKAKTPANIATQALYDALVGNHVLFDLTGGVYTVDESTVDNNNNSLIIQNLDVKKYPNMVAFTVQLEGTVLSEFN